MVTKWDCLAKKYMYIINGFTVYMYTGESSSCSNTITNYPV